MTKKKWLIGVGAFFFVAIFAFIIIQMNSSYSLLDNHVRVKEDSELTYYLDIIYDGKDKNVVMSSDEATADVRSDYIYVEDKIPDGLTFVGFVESADGTIGAVRRSDGTTACGGYVVDGMDGLTYDEATRTVSFKVKNLQAGCKLTVGIITRTPTLGDKTRMDFYNTAFGRENSFTTSSNTVHVFMGKEEIDLYSVTYQYTGTVPDNAPTLPEASTYAEGDTVGLLGGVSVPGYTFSGWSTTDATITDSSFTMPAANVVLSGSFTENPTYSVTYQISGDAPAGYIVPNTKTYGVGEDVIIDTLASGDVIAGYRFLGWTTTDATVTDGIFQMPEANVTLTGTFEEITYSVTYQFQGTVLPDNADSLLPATKSYKPGETVTREADPEAEGYKFLGWYKAETFEMPEEDVVIYGEWMVQAGTFTPTINKVITNQKDYYTEGEIVTFEITVTNPNDFAITDVMLQEVNENAEFVSGDGYTVLNSQFARIDTIAANSSVVVNAQYVVGSEAYTTLSNTVMLTGALADNDYNLDTTQTYESSTTFSVANISLRVVNKNTSSELLTGSEYTLYEDASCTNEISTGLFFEDLLPNTTYYLKETRVATGYVINKTIHSVVVSNTGEITIADYELAGSDGDYTITIYSNQINILPNTGGIGTVPYVIVGILVMIVGAVGLIFFMKKRDGGDSDEKKDKK